MEAAFSFYAHQHFSLLLHVTKPSVQAAALRVVGKPARGTPLLVYVPPLAPGQWLSMPGGWSWGSQRRDLGAGTHSALLQLNLSLSNFALTCLPGQETQSFLRAPSKADLQPPRLEACWDRSRRVVQTDLEKATDFRAAGKLQYNSEVLQQSAPSTTLPGCRENQGIFFCLACQDHITLNIPCPLMAILEFTAQALSHFLPTLSCALGVRSWAPTSSAPGACEATSNPTAQSRATSHPLAPEGRSRSRGQEPAHADTGDTLWVLHFHLYLYWHPTVCALNESEIKSNCLCDSEDFYSCPEVLDYCADGSCANAVC